MFGKPIINKGSFVLNSMIWTKKENMHKIMHFNVLIIWSSDWVNWTICQMSVNWWESLSIKMLSIPMRTNDLSWYFRSTGRLIKINKYYIQIWVVLYLNVATQVTKKIKIIYLQMKSWDQTGHKDPSRNSKSKVPQMVKIRSLMFLIIRKTMGKLSN